MPGQRVGGSGQGGGGSGQGGGEPGQGVGGTGRGGGGTGQAGLPPASPSLEEEQQLLPLVGELEQGPLRPTGNEGSE